MTRNMYIAAVFAFATVLTQANQCTNGGAGCTGDSVPQNIVSMLQTNLKTNVLKGGGQEDNSNEQIAELMAQEKDAIASEDFVAAQNLKSEINALQSKAASSGVLDAGADVDGKKESLVGNMLMLNKPAAILTELEQKVTAGEVPAFDVISQIKTLVTDDIMPYLQDSRDQAIQQATELRALVTACNEDFKSSDAYPGSTMEQAVNTARSNHITCRDAQDTAHAFNLTQPDSYCVKLGELLHDTMPLSSPGASASPRATSVASVVSALHTMPSCNSDVLQLDANCTQQETELANKHQECSLKQETFEFRFCEWKDGLESKCKTLDSCYSTTSGLYNAHVAQMKTSLEKWDIENKTLHTILCYCNVWLRSTDSADNRSQHNASHFEACKVSTHPTEVVELVPTQKDDCMLGSVSNHPGTQAFTDQEYGSVTDFVAPVIPCIPDCGVNEKIVENVCVACPAGKTSPGRNSTICDATLCGTDEKVVGHICVKCAPGKMSMSNNDASGADTQCQATKCGANEKVVDHVCVQCPAGKIGSGDDDASGGNTQCEATTTTTTTTEANSPNIDGGGWKLVRHAPAGQWHPARDFLVGTEVYGTSPRDGTSSAAWSIEFKDDDFDQFLFATADLTKWLIATKDQVVGEFYGHEKRNIIKSSSSDEPYQAYWVRREDHPEDPWISLADHPSGCLYGGSNTFWHQLPSHYGGANVFIRKAR